MIVPSADVRTELRRARRRGALLSGDVMCPETRRCFGGLPWQGAIATSAQRGPLTPITAAPGCVWWVEADQEVLIAAGEPAGDGQAVQIWGDLIGSNDLTQSVFADRPTYDHTVGPGNQRAIVGAPGESLSNTTNIADTYTFILCGWHNTNTSGQTSVMRWHNGAQYMLFQSWNSNGSASLFNGTHHQFASALPLNSNYVMSTTRTTAHAHTGRINGPTNTCTPFNPGSSTHFAPREVFQNAFAYTDGAIYGMALYDSVLSDSARLAAETYWADKYGVTLA